MATNISYSAIVEKLRRTFASRKTFPIEYRKQQLLQLKKLLEENEDALAQAICMDIRKPKVEAVCYEVLFTINDVDTALTNLNEWTKPTKVTRHFLQIFDSAYITKDPLGVVAIISPWNYPVHLMFSPLVGAIAAGNCAVLKPSEVASHTADVINTLVPKYLDQDAFRVITGGVMETTALLRERFDHIMYTGSTTVGKVVMEAASKHLTPVTLELGGKSPVIVDSNCDLVIAGRRIAWGKFMACGQTCLAPDYILCHADVKDRLIQEIKNAVKTYYGDDAQKSNDYARIIGEKHFDRLVAMLDKAATQHGGHHDRSDLYIEPTIIDDVKPTDKVMETEIFGPLLPVLTVKNLQEAIDFINEREKPLAVYIFSSNKKHIQEVLTKTSSGGVTVNDVVLHLALDTLPFGGVGSSGMGRYHGKFTFDTFTHEKAVLHRGTKGEALLWMNYLVKSSSSSPTEGASSRDAPITVLPINRMRYPPYNDSKYKWARGFSKKRTLPSFKFVPYLALFVVGLVLGAMIR